jgi:hypothetical protein
MAYALGHDRALAHLQKDLAAFPALRTQLDRSRDVVAGASTWDGTKPPARGEQERDLYSAWFTAIRGLSATPEGALPSFMSTDAFHDMRVASAVAGYGQIRHNYVLMVPMTWDESGCEIPDGYVEPAPAVYQALIAYAERGERAMRHFDHDGGASATYFTRLGRLLHVLSRIADRELANEPLRDEERRFLAMVAEEVTWHTSAYSRQPTYEGWFYDLHLSPAEALEDARLVADFFGSSNSGTVDYAGVSGVRLGIFVVDTGGGARLAVGPVTRAFQAKGGISPRFSDDDIGRFSTQAPWSRSYTSPKSSEPSFSLRTAHGEASADIILEATSVTSVGPVTISLLDHHRVPIASLTQNLQGSPGRPAKVRFVFHDFDVKDAEVAQFGVEGLSVSAGELHFVDTEVQQYNLETGEERWDFGPGKTHPPRPTRGRHVSGRGKRF